MTHTDMKGESLSLVMCARSVVYEEAVSVVFNRAPTDEEMDRLQAMLSATPALAASTPRGSESASPSAQAASVDASSGAQ